MPIKQTRVALNTTTGTQDITISGIGTPKAAMVILQNASTDDTNTANATACIGFTDGTRGVHSWINSRNGVSSSSTRRRTGDNSWGFSYDPSGFVVTDFDFQSWITDGVRINITSANGDDCFATFVFFYGSDVLNVYCDLVQLTSTSLNVTAPNFEPDLVIVAGNGDASQDTRTVHAIQSYGFAINDVSETNAGLFYYDENSQTTMDNGQYVSNTACAGQYFNGTLSYQTSVDTFDSQGFTFTSTAATGNDYVIYLAVEFDALDLSLTVEDSPASTGSYSITAGFTPQFSMLLASRTTAVNTGDTTNAGQLTLYTVDGTNDYSAVYSSEDAVSTSDTVTRSSSGKVVTLDNTSAVENEGTFTSFGASGPTFNFTSVGASQHKWVHLSIEEASAGGLIIIPTGIPSAEAFGTATVENKLQILSGAGAIPSAESFGTPTLELKLQFITGAGAIASEEAFGNPTVVKFSAGLTISPTGIPTEEAFGTPNLVYGQIILPAGIVSEEAFGTLRIIGGDVVTIPPQFRNTFNDIARYLRTQGYTGQTNDIIVRWLIDQGVLSTEFNLAWVQYLETLGFEGSFSDRLEAWRIS